MHGHVTLLNWTPDMEAMIASGGRISTMDGTADEIRAKSLAAGKEKNEKLIGQVAPLCRLFRRGLCCAGASVAAGADTV